MMVEGPVGRQAVWAALLARLRAPTSSVVLLAGPPGSGRTHLLAKIGEAAQSLERTVIGCDDPLVVEPTTKLSDIHRTLAALLGSEDNATRENETSTLLHRLRNFLNPVDESTKDERDMLKLLDRAAPAIVAIDGFSPSKALASWFTSRLIPHLRASPTPIMLVVTDRGEGLAELRGIADEVIELDMLDREEVSQHLRSLGRGLRPPLPDEEVAAYCDAIVADPSLLTPLGEVFSVLAAER